MTRAPVRWGEGDDVAVDESALTEKAQPLSAVAPKIQNGDILLCSADDPFSRLIAWSTKSPWTHVAFAWRWPGVERILALECVQQLGVRAVPIERFISETSGGTHPYPGKIVLARNQAVAEAKDIEPILAFALTSLGDRFSPGEIAKIATRSAFGRLAREMPKPLRARNEFICSEFIDRCYRKAGVKIPWDGLGFIAPADIARDARLNAVARFRTH